MLSLPLAILPRFLRESVIDRDSGFVVFVKVYRPLTEVLQGF